MPVLVYAETENGNFRKTAFETLSYARSLANELSTTVTAVALNATQANLLANYGADKILQVTEPRLQQFHVGACARLLQQAIQKENAQLIVLSSSVNAKYIAPLLAIYTEAAYIPNVIGLPQNLQPLRVKQTAYSNKAFSITEIRSERAIIGIAKNSFGLKESPVETTLETFTPNWDKADFDVPIQRTEAVKGAITIADAEIVVSGGRGLKGPENWGMIEELAHVLGAATACSKPVSDLGWRPHSEHVGQTGKPVACNLYIAIGISGAIQHLAGVNASKIKVVINSDPDAPFFKAADYGVVGNAFEVVPKLIEKLKEFKAKHT